MAYLERHETVTLGFLTAVLEPARAIFRSFSLARAAAGEFDALSSLSDDELTRRGLNRRSIAQDVARRHGIIA
jgi:hypothetical protein